MQLSASIDMSRANVAVAALAILLASSPVAAADAVKRCDWHAPKAPGESSYKRCLDYKAMNGTTLTLPGNVTRISRDGISFCEGVVVQDTGEADIIYLMDNSGSMESGETAGGFRTPPGDPFGVRDKMIRRGMRQERATAKLGTAGFISFIGIDPVSGLHKDILGKELAKIQHPLDISRSFPQGQANLDILLKKVWKHNPNEVNLPKVAKSNGIRLTYWTEPLNLAIEWLKPDSGFMKTKNRALILVSDGAIGDWDNVSKMIKDLPPVYGIHLGTDVQADHIKNLASLTGGQFFLVPPTDTLVFQQVMNKIIGIITKNPLPKAVTVTNRTFAPPQVAVSAAMAVNPDASLGVMLDSIVGLKVGPNDIALHITHEDNTTVDYGFNLDVADANISGSTENYSCYDMPTLTALDKTGKTPPIYLPTNPVYDLRLTRSPSELTFVNVAASSETGDRENIQLPVGNSVLGFPTQKAEWKLNANDNTPTPGNGTLEVSKGGNLTFVFSHPRDPRETVTYVMLGSIAPIVPGVVNIQIVRPVVQGGSVNISSGGGIINPIVIQDPNRRTCLQNCGTGIEIGQNGIPAWNITVRSAFTASMHVYDNLGQFVNRRLNIEFSKADWDKLVKVNDEATVVMQFLPIAENGQMIGTGAYVMQVDISTEEDKVIRDSTGAQKIVKSGRTKYLKRFGYVRE